MGVYEGLGSLMGGLKPFSQACINNRQPIAEILQRVFAGTTRVLEIGSGTGQHAIYFAPLLRHLVWQPSDCVDNLPGIHAWLESCPSENLHLPIALNVDELWPDSGFDGFFTANTCHIMPWQSVVNMFAGIGHLTRGPATLAIYGPFKYRGRFTTESNARFDAWLKAQAPHQGVRNAEEIISLAEDIGFQLLEDNPMPANNQLLVFTNG